MQKNGSLKIYRTRHLYDGIEDPVEAEQLESTPLSNVLTLLF